MLIRTGRRQALLALAAAAVIVHATDVHANPYPSRPVTLVVPFAAGGAFDVVARLVGERLAAELGQPVIVENKPGAGGTQGGRQVSRAQPDGHTLLLSGVGPVSIAPAVYKNLDYDPLTALEPVAQLTSSPMLLATTPGFTGTTVEDFVRYLKAAPGRHNYASTGNGTIVHLAGEYFKTATGTAFAHIPYAGGSQVTNSLLAGETTFTITNVPNVLGQIRAGKLKGLATTGTRRPAAVPELPTMQEAGLAGFDVTGWIGIFAPKATPQPVIERLNAALNKVLQDPALRQRLEQQGDAIAVGSVQEFQRFLVASAATWKRVAQQANVTID